MGEKQDKKIARDLRRAYQASIPERILKFTFALILMPIVMPLLLLFIVPVQCFKENKWPWGVE